MPAKRSRTPTKAVAAKDSSAPASPSASPGSATKKQRVTAPIAKEAAATPQKQQQKQKQKETVEVKKTPAKGPSSSSKKSARSSKPALSVEPCVMDVADDAAPNSGVSAAAMSRLEQVILRSKVIAPDVSGLSCLAVNHSETEVVVARENGSLVLYSVEYFQGIPHFTQLRHTGGCVRRTITHMEFLDLSSMENMERGSAHYADRKDRYLLVSYLSGQLIVYDCETLFPVSVYQRIGGAVWDFTVSGSRVYSAVADGSWHQLRITFSSSTRKPQLQLERIIPAISGADRAFSVTSSAALGMAVGTDDAGNVHAWRLPAPADQSTVTTTAERKDGLSAHESLWTTRLPKGMAMCAAIATGTRPVVAVGTSMGDVVLLDAATGSIFATFSQHKGPVSTIVCDNGVLFASGWHESLRSYRCDESGEWYPAEVKRRTHYHEASQLVVLSQRQLMLSASRDGTIMYAPVAQLFTTPALYVTVTTQQFAYAQEKDILLHSRLDRIEAFRMDAAMRHWVPLFAHNVHGKFHINGLWCDPELRYIVFATDERVVLCKLICREGAEDAFVITRIEEAMELPAGCGVLDVMFAKDDSDNKSEEEEAVSSSSSSSRVYILQDDAVVCVSLAEGYPMVRTAFPTSSSSDAAEAQAALAAASSPALRNRGVRPTRLVRRGAQLHVFGLRGKWVCELSADGTPDATSFRLSTDVHTDVQDVPAVVVPDASASTTTTAAAPVVVGLSAAEKRYARGLTDNHASLLPLSLPHATTFVAQIPPPTAAADASSSPLLLGYFARGLVLVDAQTWRMPVRMSVEAAFVMRDRKHVLVLERNLEKTLEALPLCWKVRRFGN